MKQFVHEARQLEPYMIQIRRDLHQYPELSLQEKETASMVAQQLSDMGLTVRTQVGGYGVVADVHGMHAGPLIALRADMDALPIQEEADVPFASKVPGVMHACGHDAHTAMLLGAARILTANRKQLNGSVRLIFQGAEEVNGGAMRMIEAGVLDGVQEIYGLHNLPTSRAGFVGTRSGGLMASVDTFELVVEGKGGHGAMPEQSIDPIVAAASIIMGLQTAVSREISPSEPCVVTVASMQAGHANNVIPHQATLTGTVRTFSQPLQRTMAERLRRIVTHMAAAYRCQVRFDYAEQVPVLFNDATCVSYVEETVDEMLGKSARGEAEQSMAGEDFAMYLRHVPGCFFWLGSGPDEHPEQAYGLHHPKFQINEACLSTGAALLAAIAAKRTKD